MTIRTHALLGSVLALLLPALASAATPKGACHLLTDAEIAAAFPGAKPGVPETAREKYGILGCEWSTTAGRVVAQFWKNQSPTTAREEASGLMIGVLDPLKGSAGKAVRYEAIPGVGDTAVVALAKRDAAAGVLSDLAMAVVVGGGRTITIMSPELLQRDPAKAIAILSALARSASKR
jgi:hypothetical protein